MQYHHTYCDNFDKYESFLRCISIIIFVHGSEVLLWEEPIYQLLIKTEKPDFAFVLLSNVSTTTHARN